MRAVILSSDVLRTANKKLVHVVMSTLSVALARELEKAHVDAGIAYVAAPVMGWPDVAGAGKLNVLAAGDDTAIESVRLLLDVIGQRTWLIGAEPHQANVAKLAIEFPARLGDRSDGRGSHLSGALRDRPINSKDVSPVRCLPRPRTQPTAG